MKKIFFNVESTTGKCRTFPSLTFDGDLSIKMTSQRRRAPIHKETDSNIKGVDMRFKNVKKTALMLAMFGMDDKLKRRTF
ncbi:hypothetical protein AAY55_11090 [Vibrio metoecus]|uniref:Uncharacterized protein n=1 Tax=Vibrio metoecus TaxID=1481663 RepID=A0A0Q0PSX8_VIBMT|nr:hypothetical protein AAY55_11090 [Vibrio metoecus]